MKFLFASALFLLVCGPGVGAIQAQSITGDWYGQLNIQGMNLRLTLHVKTDGNAYSATLDSPDQGAFGLPADELTYADGRLGFRLDQFGIRYEGQVDAAFESITGAFFLLDAFAFYSSFGRPRPEPTRNSSGRFDWPMQDNYRFFLELGPIKNVAANYFGDTIQFWSDLMSHPNYDAFWQARNPRPHLKNIKPAVLTVGGWFDAEDSFGPLRTYEAIEKQSPPTTQNRLIMGPWFHGQWASGQAERMGNVHWGFNTADYSTDLLRPAAPLAGAGMGAEGVSGNGPPSPEATAGD